MKKQLIIMSSIIGIVAMGLFFLMSPTNSSSNTLFEIDESSLEAEDDEYVVDSDVVGVEAEVFEENPQGTVFVDVQGEVINPGVFEVAHDVRIGHLIELAGGLTEDAFTRGVNQAARVHDEMVIFVPHVDDDISELLSVETTICENETMDEVDDDSNLISLSNATALELQALPRIGPVLSAAIIDYREENGDFSSVDELINVVGIGTITLENIRDLVKP